MSVLDTLRERGFIENLTDENLGKMLGENKLALYIGFDPTADSLHLGHMVPIMAAGHFQRAGHKVILLVGGATGMVGDPSGKSEERSLLSTEKVSENAGKIKGQVSAFIDFDGDNPALMVNNHEWIAPLSFIDWLRDVGKHFTVNYMIAKESVKKRLSSEQGISFTEFSYMTMQAYDFLHLYDEYGCILQCGGSDQWGNITAGVHLIQKVRGVQAYGITFPLLTTAAGEKFGKSAGNAVWLDDKRTSPFRMYQYWVRTDDRDAERFLKLFTFLSGEEIAEIVTRHSEAPEKREAQKALAAEFTRMIHGEEGLRRALQATGALYGRVIADMTDAELEDIFRDVPSVELSRSRLRDGISCLDLLVFAGACKSRGEARRLVSGGGAYINNERQNDTQAMVTADNLASRSFLVIRTGKKNYRLVKFT